MRDLLRHLNQSLERGRELILCQVVETRGSTPQKAGALMLIDPVGGQAGTLGGGCVEAEVKQKAIQRIGRPGAEIHVFVLDHDYAWADGLICGGKMVILTEALSGLEPMGYFRANQALLESGAGFTEAVVVDPDRRRGCDQRPFLLGARALVDPPGRAELEGALCADEQPATVFGDPATGVVAVAECDDGPHIRLLAVDPSVRGTLVNTATETTANVRTATAKRRAIRLAMKEAAMYLSSPTPRP